MKKCWYLENCPYCKDTDSYNPTCPAYMEMSYLMDTSNLPENKQYPIILTPPPEDYDEYVRLKNIKDNIVKFVEGGNNLYIYSKNFGNGKTSWSIKLLHQYFNEIWIGNGFRTRGIFINVPTFLNDLKNNISSKDKSFERMKNRISDVDLLVWDDIAATKLSNYDYNNLLSYIDTRVLKGLSNIYTGNIIPEDLDQYVGNRLASRIANQSTHVQLVGEDRRQVRW